MNIKHRQLGDANQSLILNNYIKITLKHHFPRHKFSSINTFSTTIKDKSLERSISSPKNTKKIKTQIYKQQPLYSTRSPDQTRTLEQSLASSFKSKKFYHQSLCLSHTLKKKRRKSEKLSEINRQHKEEFPPQKEQKLFLPHASACFTTLKEEQKEDDGIVSDRTKNLLSKYSAKNNIQSPKKQARTRYFPNTGTRRKMQLMKFIRDQKRQCLNSEQMIDFEARSLSPVLQHTKMQFQERHRNLQKIDIVRPKKQRAKKFDCLQKEQQYRPWTPKKFDPKALNFQDNENDF